MPARAIWRCARRLMSLAEKADLALVQRQRAGDQVEHRGLAGAVGPDQAQNLAGLDLEAHIVDGDKAAEAACRAGDGQDRLAAFGLLAVLERAGGEGRGGLHARQPAQREGHDAGTRPLQQQDEQHREHDDLELARGARRDHRQPVLDAVLEQGDDGRAHDRAREVGHAADHRHQEVEDADIDVEGSGADEAAHVGVEPARQRRQQRRDDEGDELYAERIDAQALRHDLAAAQGAHRPALARIEQVRRQHQGHDQEGPDQVVDAVAARRAHSRRWRSAGFR